jgi:hypothetical protein
MASAEEPTGFEWLDRPFMLTRIWLTLVATLLLAFTGYQTIYILMFVRLGPPPPPRISEGGEETERVRPTSCWGERQPLQELYGLAMASNLLAASILLCWRRPRIGFLLAAAGGLHLWPLFGMVPAAWLCFAAWKVGPARSAPDVILPPCA